MSARASILVGVYSHKGETMTRDVFAALEHFEYRFRTYDRSALRALSPGEVEVLLLPGGWYLFKEKPDIADRIRAFVRAGGGLVGICCGAINVCQLGLVPADLISMDGLGPTHIEVVDGGHPVMVGVAKRSRKPWRKYEKVDILRYNGWPMLLKKGAHMIAAYDMEMKVAAIASAQYGRGRVVAFSPHPEGATCAPGTFRDRDKLALTYDGIAMGTARLLDNAIKWCARR